MLDGNECVLIGGWNYGFRKIVFIRLVRRTLGFSLPYAMTCCDQIVAGYRVALLFADARVAAAFIAEAWETGAICDVAPERYNVPEGQYLVVDQAGACGVEAGRWKRRSTLKREASEQKEAP